MDGTTSFARILMFATVVLLVLLSMVLYEKYSEEIPKSGLNVSKMLPKGDPNDFLQDKEPARVAGVIFTAAGIFFLVVIFIYGFLKVLSDRKKKN